MGHIVTTIIPIFSIVILGILARANGFLPPAFLGPANRLVYYLAIPAMIFRAIANASLTRQLNPTIVWLTLVRPGDAIYSLLAHQSAVERFSFYLLPRQPLSTSWPEKWAQIRILQWLKFRHRPCCLRSLFHSG